jgi:flagellar biogenesis protein FliO
MKMIYIVLMVMVVCLVMVRMIIATKFEDLKRLKGQR